MLFVPPGGKHVPGPGQINLCDQNQSREKLDWDKPFYCSQESWLRSSPLAADLASPSQSMLASPPAPSWRNSEGRSPATDWHQTNYTTEGRREQHLSTPCPRGCEKKHLLICKQTKARGEIMEIAILPKHLLNEFKFQKRCCKDHSPYLCRWIWMVDYHF